VCPNSGQLRQLTSSAQITMLTLLNSAEGIMETRKLGKSGIEVTGIGLGLWAVGGGEWGAVSAREDADALSAIDCALDAGVNFFDTADKYGDGHSEQLLGRAMKGRRERFVVATKIGWQGFDGTNNHSAYTSVDKLVAGVEASLRRLGTDHLDLIQWHVDFRERTMEVCLEGFQRLQSGGKVRAYGLSTSDFGYLKAFNQDGRCATLQIDYSLLNRMAEREFFDYCQQQDIGIIVRGGLAMGLLTGKFNERSRFADGDFRNHWLTDPQRSAVYKRDLQSVERLKALARDGRSLAQAALQFTLHHPSVTTVIPGGRNASQVTANAGALTATPLSAEDLALIDGITPPGAGRRIWPA
jgi:aryl-alcohol dehydrogenase-like predicted oxidoreductase